MNPYYGWSNQQLMQPVGAMRPGLIPPLPAPGMPQARRPGLVSQPLPAPQMQQQPGNGSALSYYLPGSAVSQMMGGGGAMPQPNFSMPRPAVATQPRLRPPTAPAQGMFPAAPMSVGLAPLPATPFMMRSPEQFDPSNRQAFQSLQQSAKTYAGMGTPVSQMQTADQLIAQGAPMYDPNQRAAIARAAKLGGGAPQLQPPTSPQFVPMDQNALAARMGQMQQGAYAPGQVVGENRTKVTQGANGGIRLEGQRNTAATDQLLSQNGTDPSSMTYDEKRQALTTLRAETDRYNRALAAAKRKDRQDGRDPDLPGSMTSSIEAAGPKGFANMLRQQAGPFAQQSQNAAATATPTSITASQKLISQNLGQPDEKGNYPNANPVLASVGINRKDMKRWEYGAGVKTWLDTGSDSDDEFRVLADTIRAQSMIPDNKDFRQDPGSNVEDALAYVIQQGQVNTKDKARKFVKDYEQMMAARVPGDYLWGTAATLPPGYLMSQ